MSEAEMEKMLQEELAENPETEVEEPVAEVAPPVEAPPPVEEPQPQMVPLAALRESRAEIKDLRNKLSAVDALKQEVMRLRSTLTPPPKEPVFEEDPGEFLKQKLLKLEAMNELTRQQNEEMQAATVRKALFDRVAQDVESFRTAVPDFDNAYQHIVDLKRKEIQALGVHDDEVLEKELTKQSWQLATYALKTGQSPAKMMYDIATAYGYRKATQAPPAPQNVFQDIVDGQKASRTLQGGEPTTEPNLKALLEAEGDEFEEQWNQYFGRKKRPF